MYSHCTCRNAALDSAGANGSQEGPHSQGWWEGVCGLRGAGKETRGDAVRVTPQTRLYARGLPESPSHTPRRPEEAAGLAFGLASGGWGWTAQRRPSTPTRAEPRGVFRAGAGPGWPGGGGNVKVTLAQGGARAAWRRGPVWATWARSCDGWPG